MKKLKLFALLSACFGVLFLSSCAEEEPAEPTDPGTSSDPRDKFTDFWSIAESSQDFGTSTYNVTIADSSNVSYITLGYLYGFNKKAYATVSGNNFTMPVQLIAGNNVSGTGLLVNPNQINFVYYVQSTSTHIDTVTAQLTK
jgi:hypothetical protein